MKGGGSQDPIVEKIFFKMGEMSKNKFPINRFVEMVNSREEVEQAIPIFFSFVDELEISSKEKAMLKSIIEKKRVGSFSVFMDEEKVTSFKIKKPTDNEKNNRNFLAQELKMMLEEVVKRNPKNKKMGFSFIED